MFQNNFPCQHTLRRVTKDVYKRQVYQYSPYETLVSHALVFYISRFLAYCTTRNLEDKEFEIGVLFSFPFLCFQHSLETSLLLVSYGSVHFLSFGNPSKPFKRQIKWTFHGVLRRKAKYSLVFSDIVEVKKEKIQYMRLDRKDKRKGSYLSLIHI